VASINKIKDLQIFPDIDISGDFLPW
jgi:hypothetical protein